MAEKNGEEVTVSHSIVTYSPDCAGSSYSPGWPGTLELYLPASSFQVLELETGATIPGYTPRS